MDKLEILQSRHSVRDYNGKSLSEEDVKFLNSEITLINTHEAGLYFSLVTNDGSPLNGLKNSYGFFKGVNNYIVAVIDDHFRHAEERAGFFGEQLVIQSTERGLSTCFIGGTFSLANVNVQLRAGRRVLFIIAIGEGADKTSFMGRLVRNISHRKQMSYQDFFVSLMTLEDAEKRCPGLTYGLKGVAAAPSALNKRPVRITLDEENRPVAFVPDEKGYNPIDLGIAKFNFGYMVDGIWEWGNHAPFLRDE